VNKPKTDDVIERLIITPFQKFVRIESFSGILLFGATVIALIWANSPLSESYRNLWAFEFGVVSEWISIEKPLILWINDALMAVFFFLIGLEIKRELLIGELNTVKKASLPLIAALGGMLVPVAIYLLLNRNPDAANGWGIPMATDIAFSLAIITLLGKRVPVGLKVFLTAFAIVDDLGAVMVIAIFYSEGIKWGLIGISLLLVVLLMFLPFLRFYSKVLTLIIGIVVWYLFLKAGIHPTLAGVLMAFTVPIRQRIDTNTYQNKLSMIASNFDNEINKKAPILTGHQIECIDTLEDWTEKVQSPLQHLEHKLHYWVAYLVIPVFALANAGVIFSDDMNLDLTLSLVIVVSLFIGKSLGIPLFTYIGLKLNLIELPDGVTFNQVFGIAFLGGIGFTMSIFIGNLAFSGQPQLMDSAKISILVGSTLSGLAGYFLLRGIGKKFRARQSS
jgi:NhaA family Na+:H+ antiporter